MRSILTSSQKAASALRRAETALRNWQDDPDSPRSDVNELLRMIADMRALVQGHVLEDIERAHERSRSARSSASAAHAGETVIAEEVEAYDHLPRDTE